MPRTTLPLLLALALALSAPTRADAETFRLDPVHSRVMFQVDHAGFSRAIGTFSGPTGVLSFDPERWQDATLDVVIRVDSLDLGDARWREKILDRTFLASDQFPEAHFTSTRVEPTGDGSGRVIGALTLHGVTREITLDVHLNALKRHPLTRRRTAGFSATATLVRADFGMDAWPNVVGGEIALVIEAEAILDRSAQLPEADDGDNDES
jgi:polyisoprenoid-binding protein YceI